ncbi:MAG: DJ-1/PfpI family protein [Deltaproteobacteria bacterium]|nr:DJ-1/PfpI family protein [Deltaproteobacteria bacterium]
MLLPDREFDPTESAVPWRILRAAGHSVGFATESGNPGRADQQTLHGDGLPLLAGALRCRAEGCHAYEAMERDPAFLAPKPWSSVDPDGFDALILPGGHAPGMKPYLESEEVQRIIRVFFERDAPVAAVCHGVLAVARTRRADDQRSVLYGRRTTGLTNFQEKIAIGMTRRALGDHYRTYPETVQDEVSALLASPGDFLTGGWLPRMGSEAQPKLGFVVRDGNYVSARFPGDVYRWATTIRDMLAER